MAWLSATTSATHSPTKRTRSIATTGRSGTLVPGMIQLGTIEPILPARSEPDNARRTPGAAFAAERSTCLMLA